MYLCIVYRDVTPPSGAFSLCGCLVSPESGTSCHILRIYTSLLLTEIKYYNTYHDKHQDKERLSMAIPPLRVNQTFILP